MDLMKESFEQTIQDYIFSDISVEELAEKCNRSLTSFKKEFREAFLRTASQMVHPPAPDAFAAAADIDQQVDLRNRKRM